MSVHPLTPSAQPLAHGPALEANPAEDYRQVDSRGGVQNRRGFTDRLMSPALVIDPYTVDDFDIPACTATSPC